MDVPNSSLRACLLAYLIRGKGKEEKFFFGFLDASYKSMIGYVCPSIHQLVCLSVCCQLKKNQRKSMKIPEIT